jgi:hypothetical protein
MTLYTEHEDKENDGYATKPSLWRPLAQAVDGFDVDPASGAENEQIAEAVYTIEDDGLQQTWDGKVWLNPPFSEKLPFFRKAINELQAGNADLIISLAPVDTSTEWFQQWFSRADRLCWLEGRDWYQANGSPSFNTVVGVFGDYPDSVLDVLDSKGTLTEPIDRHTQETLV